MSAPKICRDCGVEVGPDQMGVRCQSGEYQCDSCYEIDRAELRHAELKHEVERLRRRVDVVEQLLATFAGVVGDYELARAA